MIKYLIDTNISIYYFSQFPPIIHFTKDTLKNPMNENLISVVSEAELLSTRTIHEDPVFEENINDFIDCVNDVLIETETL